MRERELKLDLMASLASNTKSLPMRERELKRRLAGVAHVARLVAPHAGARIETRDVREKNRNPRVAPHAGARIETQRVAPTGKSWRGAPHAGARIETHPCVR